MLQKFSFLGLETSFKDAEYVILPVPYSFSSGIECARETPYEVIKQSLYIPSQEEGRYLNNLSIHTMDFFFPNVDPEKNARDLSGILEMITSHQKTPVMIGGDHSITLGARDHFDTFLVIDAHFDLMDLYMGSKYSHACISRRLLEAGKEVYFWGVREKEPEENPPKNSLLREPPVGKNIYLSIDLDVLDPSIVKVQTPSPNGKSFSELMNFIKKTIDQNTIVGMDITEGCAEPYTAQLIARILSKTISYF